MRQGVSVNDFALGELVLIRRHNGEHMGLAHVIDQPEQFKQNHAPDEYVWVRFIHDGEEDGWRPDCVYKAKEQDDDH